MFCLFFCVVSATRALREMTNFSFYGKPMHVSFAKMKSDVISKADGSFVARPKRKVASADNKNDTKNTKKAKTEENEKDSDKAGKKDKTDTVGAGGPPSSGAAAPVSAPAAPNRILFIENLPSAATELMLSMLFQQYGGFKEARMVPGKPGIAFVEFNEIFQASQAMEALQVYKTHITNTIYICMHIAVHCWCRLFILLLHIVCLLLFLYFYVLFFVGFQSYRH